MVLIVLLSGLAIVATIWFFHMRTVKKANASAGWPVAQGVIQASAVRANLETDAEGDAERAYYANVHYSYAVNGVTYTGDRIAFGGPNRFATAGGAQAICDRYVQGASVPVRYDPANPAEAVLESKKPSPLAPIVFSVVVMIFTLIAGAIFAPA